jgi:16S rRNA (cytosine967-C5)-methyltransferase
MEARVVEIALDVIRGADREHPADEVLRAALKRAGVRPELSRAVAQAVFRYYRWFGWLAAGQPSAEQLQAAEGLDGRYARQPGSFSDAELLRRAAPGWTQEQMECPPDWLRGLQQPPKLWLRARPGQASELARKLGGPQAAPAGPLPEALEYTGGRDLFRTPEFHAGEFEVQDLSSQAIGWMCAPQPGETWWDACAGEGGKTLHFSDLMRNQGLIWASDRAAWRLARLKRRAARARVFNYRAAAWNGSARLPTKTRFDGVLVDAPCSGVGTWQRHPQARWTTTAEDIRQLGQIQQALLARAAAAVKPGGQLVYAVCTLTRAETSEVAEALERRFPELQPLGLANPLAPAQPRAPRWWLWPQQCGGNGMFVAAWRREGGDLMALRNVKN